MKLYDKQQCDQIQKNQFVNDSLMIQIKINALLANIVQQQWVFFLNRYKQYILLTQFIIYKYYQRRMLKRCVSPKLLTIAILLCLVLDAQSYNSFWKCKDSLLLGSKRFQFIKDAIIRFPNVNWFDKNKVFNIIDQFQQQGLQNHNLFLTDMSTLDSSSALGRCKNFIMSGESCCQKESFQNFLNSMIAAMGYLWSFHTYPIVQFGKDFQSFVCHYQCFPWWRVIDHDDFWRYYDRYKPALNALANFEIQFLTETACLMCMGPKDFSTFIYPNPDRGSPSNILIYDKQYFKNKVNTYANLLMNLESLNEDLIQKIFYYAQAIPNQSCVPQTMPKFKDRLSMYKFQNCNNWEGCRKVAAAYIGQAAAPYFLWHIKNPVNTQGSEGTDIYLSQNADYGFKGNASYKLTYRNQYLPDVTIIKKNNAFDIDITPIK